MQGFGAQTHLFSEVTGPQQFEQTKKKCPMDLRKLLTPFLLTPLQRDFLTMLRPKSDFRGFPESNPKVTPKVTVWPEKWLKSDFFRPKCYFGGYFWVTLGETPKVTFESLSSNF